MTDKQECISDEDLNFIDDFLLYRIDEDAEAEAEGRDEGILCLSELDGFFTAIVSGPVLIPPSQWLPEVWGDFEPVWETEQEAQKVIMLMMDIMNSSAATLMERPEEYQPLFEGSNIDNKEYIIVDEWCEGYMRGVALASDEWFSAGLDMEILLTPVRAFTELSNWMGHEVDTREELVNLQNAVAINAKEIHAYWLARRDADKPAASTIRRESPRIGRNDPCPCGSGKKYKKCCLH